MTSSLPGMSARPETGRELVYTASRDQVTDVWVAGRRLLANRQLTTLDAGAIASRAQDWRDKIISG